MREMVAISESHLDAIIRAGLLAPKEGSRKTFCPSCSRFREKADRPCVQIFPYEASVQWRCRNCGVRGEAMVR